MARAVLRLSCDFSGVSWGASGPSRARSDYLADVSGIFRWYVVDIEWLSEEIWGKLGISRDMSGISWGYVDYIPLTFHSYLRKPRGYVWISREHLGDISGGLGIS